MRLNDVLTVIGLSLISTAINIPQSYSTLSGECPGRDVPTIRRQADQTELSFIFYYVSWCHESRAAKKVYDEVAQHYYDQANFAAVNCWHMECNCSYTFPSALGSKKGYPVKWPTLLVRYGRRMLVQYYDEWKFSSLSKFIESLYKPVERLHARTELKALTLRSNAVVLGLFPNVSTSDYRKFSFAAVKWLESDPERLIRFAVGLGPVAENIIRLGAKVPLIALLSEKNVQVFNSSVKWTADNVVSWLKVEVKRIRKQFYGFSTPSILAENVLRGAVLTIFVNELENEKSNFYHQMKRVLKNVGYVPPDQPTLRQCEQFWDTGEHDLSKREYVVKLKMEYNRKNSLNNSCLAKPLLNAAYTPYDELRQKYVRAFLMQYQPSAKQQAEDPYSSENLLQLYQYNECLQLTTTEGTPELQVVIAKLLSKFIKRIAAESSVTNNNRTMFVHIMDARKYQALLRELGYVNFENIPLTTALIIEPTQEGIYLMRKPFHYELLLKFIKSYYNDGLQITRRSSGVTLSLTSLPNEIRELNRHMFLNNLKHHWRNTTTVLLLYSPRCAISWMMSHALLQVSAMFESSQGHHNINIVRINTQTNDLPWEFVMNTVPALIVFPRGHPDESRLFPSDMKINARNIFGFILAQLDPIEQVHVALGSCTLPTQKLLKCLQFVNTLTMQHISEHLKLWQRFASDRQAILRRLKLFKDIILNIQASFPL